MDVHSPSRVFKGLGLQSPTRVFRGVGVTLFKKVLTLVQDLRRFSFYLFFFLLNKSLKGCPWSTCDNYNRYI